MILMHKKAKNINFGDCHTVLYSILGVIEVALVATPTTLTTSRLQFKQDSSGYINRSFYGSNKTRRKYKCKRNAW